MQGKVRVLIVDDAVVVRRMLADILDSDPELEVVGTAANGKAALEKMPQVEPQVVILDIDMPEMNGIETLIEIRKRDGTIPVIMFSTSTERGASTTLEALSRGATDYVTKPSTMRGARSAVDAIRQELVPKIKALGKRRLRTAGMRTRPAVPVPASVKRPSPAARPRWVEPYLPPDPETPRPRFGRRALPVSIVSSRLVRRPVDQMRWPSSFRSCLQTFLSR